MNFFRLKIYFNFLLLVGIFSFSVVAQSVAKSTFVEENFAIEACANPTPTPKKTGKPVPKPKPKPAEAKVEVEMPAEMPEEAEEPLKTSEKAIQTEAKVNVSLCVNEGKVKVTGWERNEVRVFVNEGNSIGFKVRQKDKSSDKPILLDILNPNSKSEKPCLNGDEIEIDVPKNATVEFGGQESETIFDSISKVRIETNSGNISLNNIENGVEAKTYEGLITLDKVKGNINVYSSSGGIIAYNLSPNEPSDSFKARTESGVINLQNISHSRLETKSISGIIKYSGEFLNGGSYNFGTTSGLIQLSIPNDSSCKIIATFGYGSFNSEIPFKTLTKDISSTAKKMVLQMGTGEADVSISTFSSVIKIKALKK